MHSRLFHHEDQTPEKCGFLTPSSVLSRSRNTKHFSEFQVHFYCDVTKDPKNLESRIVLVFAPITTGFEAQFTDSKTGGLYSGGGSLKVVELRCRISQPTP